MCRLAPLRRDTRFGKRARAAMPVDLVIDGRWLRCQWSPRRGSMTALATAFISTLGAAAPLPVDLIVQNRIVCERLMSWHEVTVSYPIRQLRR